MKKINKLLLIIISIMLVLGPSFVYAVEGDNTESNSGEVAENNGSTNTENNNTDDETENNNADNENKDEEDESTVEEQKSIKFDMEETESTLKTGETLLLKVIVTPSDAKVTWVSSNEKVAKVDSTGLVTALDKSGEATITAKLNDVIKAEYKIKVDAPKSTDATLKDLTVNGTLSPEFKSDVYEYTIELDKNVTSIDFEPVLSDDSAKPFPPSDSKNKSLKNGDVLTFKVVAEDGKTSQSYKFTVVKEASSLDLKSLYINGYALNEIFDPTITDYTASIPYEIETITVKTSSEATENEVSIKVSGITKLKVGDNTVKVVVTDKSDNTKTNTYTIVVTREKEVSVEEKPTSIITSSGITGEDGNNTSKPSSGNDKNNNDSGSDDFLKYAIVSLACLILFAIGGIGIYFYIRTSPRKLKKMLVVQKTEEESPIVEVDNENNVNNQSNIEQMMEEKLVETREFRQEDLQQLDETDNLFDDKKDV